jgi:hypothetical protein
MFGLHFASSVTVTCPHFMSFLIAVPDSLGFALGSFGTLGSTSAGLPVIGFSSFKLDGSTVFDVELSLSLGVL